MVIMAWPFMQSRGDLYRNARHEWQGFYAAFKRWRLLRFIAYIFNSIAGFIYRVINIFTGLFSRAFIYIAACNAKAGEQKNE
tara:strand:+ start:13328 stop:13573 length:246 start_codon:yes stop_codon:yes gene_type:complete